MVFGRKPKVIEPAPAPPAAMPTTTPALPVASTEQELRARVLVNQFTSEYDGIVSQGSDTIMSNLLFALYGEQRKTNDLLTKLVSIVEKQQ